MWTTWGEEDLLSTGLSSEQQQSRSGEEDQQEKFEEETWVAQGCLDWWTAWSALGLPKNLQYSLREDTLRGRMCDPSQG